MTAFPERYVTDENGNRTAVIVPLEQYREILEDLEELESIRAYETAKAVGDDVVPFAQAVREIELPGK